MNSFIQLKKYFTERLKHEIEENRVDKDIIDLLWLINRHPYLFTSSSCSGRIQLYSSHLPGDKFSLINIVKWHKPPEYTEFKRYVYDSYVKELWLAVVPPILHISTLNIHYAEKMLKIALISGFKHSGIISLGKGRVVVEIVGSERIEMPLKIGNKILIAENDLHIVFKLCIELLMRSKSKLFRLKENMRKIVYGYT